MNADRSWQVQSMHPEYAAPQRLARSPRCVQRFRVLPFAHTRHAAERYVDESFGERAIAHAPLHERDEIGA